MQCGFLYCGGCRDSLILCLRHVLCRVSENPSCREPLEARRAHRIVWVFVGAFPVDDNNNVDREQYTRDFLAGSLRLPPRLREKGTI